MTFLIVGPLDIALFGYKTFHMHNFFHSSPFCKMFNRVYTWYTWLHH